MITTSGLTFILARYISDNLYERRFNKILPSFYGAQVILLLFGGIVGMVFLILSPLSFIYKFMAYILYAVLNILWVEMTYISTVRNHVEIMESFLASATIIVILSLVFVNLVHFNIAVELLFCVLCGFLFIVIMFARYIKGFYKGSGAGIYRSLSYFKKFYSLFWAGTFLTLGSYIHNFIFWSSEYKVVLAHTFVFCPEYDIPVFYSIITAVPAMVMFVAVMEPRFFAKYKALYVLIFKNETITEIEKVKKKCWSL